MIYLAVMLITHFIADFILQTDKTAKGKSRSNPVLMNHCVVYGACFLWVSIEAAVFLGVSHFVIDWVTSRKNAILWEKQEVHAFFVSVGLDQLLHQMCIILVIQHMDLI